MFVTDMQAFVTLLILMTSTNCNVDVSIIHVGHNAKNAVQDLFKRSGDRPVILRILFANVRLCLYIKTNIKAV